MLRRLLPVILLSLWASVSFAQGFTFTNPPSLQPASPRVGIANPAAPLLTGSGTTGGMTTYTYAVVAYGHDATGTAQPTLMGAPAIVNTGQAVLSSGTPIVITTQTDLGAFAYDFIKLSGGAWKSLCLDVPAPANGAGVTCSDTGQTPSAYSLPQANLSNDIVATSAATNIFAQQCTAASCPVTANNVACNATSNAVAVDLPVSNGTYRHVQVCKTDASANACTLTPHGSDQIAGASTFALTTQNQCVQTVDVSAGNWVLYSTAGPVPPPPVSPPVFPTYTVATLPTCNSSLTNRSANVSDSLNTCAAGNALAGSGSNNCAVECNDSTSTWRILGTAVAKGCPASDGIYYASACGLVAAGTATNAYDHDSTQATANQTAACNTINSVMSAGDTFKFDQSGTGVYNLYGGVAARQDLNITGDLGVIVKFESTNQNAACGTGVDNSFGFTDGNYYLTPGQGGNRFPSGSRVYNLGTGYFTQGQLTFTGVTPSPAGEAAGSEMYIEYGVNPDDPGVSYGHQWLKVASTTSSSITFTTGLSQPDPPLGYAGVNTGFDWRPNRDFAIEGLQHVMITPDASLQPSCSGSPCNYSYEQISGNVPAVSGATPPTFPSAIGGTVVDNEAEWINRGQTLFPSTNACAFCDEPSVAVAGLTVNHFHVSNLSFITVLTVAQNVLIFGTRLRDFAVDHVTLIDTGGETPNTGGGIYSFINDNASITNIVAYETRGAFIGTSCDYGTVIRNVKDYSAEYTGIYQEGPSRTLTVDSAEVIAGPSEGANQLLFLSSGVTAANVHNYTCENDFSDGAQCLDTEYNAQFKIDGLTLKGAYAYASLRGVSGSVGAPYGELFGGQIKKYTIGRNIAANQLYRVPFPNGLVKYLGGQYTDTTFTGLAAVWIDNGATTHACTLNNGAGYNTFPTNGSFGDLTSWNTSGAGAGFSPNDLCQTLAGASIDTSFELNEEPTGRTLWILTGPGVPANTYLTLEAETIIPNGGDDGVGGAVSDVQASLSSGVVTQVLWGDYFPGSLSTTTGFPWPMSNAYARSPFITGSVGCTITAITASVDQLPVGCSTYPEVQANSFPAQYLTASLQIGPTPTVTSTQLGVTGGGLYTLTLSTPIFVPPNTTELTFIDPGDSGCSTEAQNLSVKFLGHCP